jgi:hypothetical protein
LAKRLQFLELDGGNQMNRILKSLIFGSTLALSSMGGPMLASAETPPPEQGQAQAPAKAKIQGSVVSVDTTAHTLTLKEASGQKTFQVNPKAEISKGGKKVSLGSVKPGDKLTGYAHTTKGHEMLDSLKISG